MNDKSPPSFVELMTVYIFFCPLVGILYDWLNQSQLIGYIAYIVLFVVCAFFMKISLNYMKTSLNKEQILGMRIYQVLNILFCMACGLYVYFKYLQ